MTTFEVFTLFPDVISGFVRAGLLGKAIERDLVEVRCTNFRDFTHDRHRTVDDTPFGGGAGMVIKPEPVVDALEAVVADRGPMHRILLTPSAPRFDQQVAARLAKVPRIALLCGRYEGIDDRVREHFVDEALSIGDFVLGGGEVAALVVIEAVSRLVEGVLGNEASAVGESFATDAGGGLLEFPQYTRPAQFRGHEVPPVLLEGNHAAIAQWRQDAARRRTWSLRPDLRRSRPLAADTPIHLAIDPRDYEPQQVAPMLGELIRGHDLQGLALVGGDHEHSVAWARAAGGRVQVTAFPDLKALRKRISQRRRKKPFVIGVVGSPRRESHSDTRAILDKIPQIDAEGQPSPVCVVVWPLGDSDTIKTGTAGIDAMYAPSSEGASDRAQKHDQTLATESSIADSSRPSFQLAERVEQLLSQLRDPDAAQ